MPFDDLRVAHQGLELGDGQLVKLLPLLLGHLLCVFVLAGDLVVLVEEDLAFALVAGTGFPGDLLLRNAHAKLLEYVLVGGECRVVLGEEVVVINGAVGIDLVGRVGVLLDLEIGGFAFTVDGCLFLGFVVFPDLGFCGTVWLRQLVDGLGDMQEMDGMDGMGMTNLNLGLLLLLLLGPAHLVLGHLWRRHLGCCCEPSLRRSRSNGYSRGVWHPRPE